MTFSFPAYTASIHHDGSGHYVQPLKTKEPALGGEALIRLRTSPKAPIQRILLRSLPDGEQHFIEMQPRQTAASNSPACLWWEARLPISMPAVGYRFLIFADEGAWWYNASGLHSYTPTDAEDFRLLADPASPSWLRDSVFYQIFPDRFANGDPGNNVRDGEYDYRGLPVKARRWGEPPSAGGGAAMVEFYGGDLAGIQSRLDYLQELGVNALYLNPIFTAGSNHRYDVTDYEHVDPHLGGNQALASLRQATGQRGMRLMLDIVPNHCGVAHPWFRAALADPSAPTAKYFTFNRHPDDYACWLGVKSLPKLNYRSQALREAMYAGPDSIFRRWLRPPYSIDGWRLDVANMLARQGADQLGMEIGQGIRQAVKQENPQAYLLGENFFDASHQLQGDCWDASMNYSGFAKPLWYWLGHFHVQQHAQPRDVASRVPWPTQSLVDTWQAYRAAIPWQIARQQFNLLTSHDTSRILTVLEGDQAKNKLAAAILLTYPGVPSVYYGDEIGMGAAKNSTSRDCMIWERAGWNQEIFSFYQTLIRLRRTSSAFIDGGFQVLNIEENCFAYLRDSEEEQVILVGNRGPGTRPAALLPVAHGAIPDGTIFTEIFSGRQAVVAQGLLPLQELPPGVEIWRTYSS